MRLKSWSQMLFRKGQKSQQNMQSTSLKVKKVTSRLSDCESFGPITVYITYAKYSFFGQSLSCGHYQPTYQLPEGVYLLNIQEKYTVLVLTSGSFYCS